MASDKKQATIEHELNAVTIRLNERAKEDGSRYEDGIALEKLKEAIRWLECREGAMDAEAELLAQRKEQAANNAHPEDCACGGTATLHYEDGAGYITCKECGREGDMIIGEPADAIRAWDEEQDLDRG